jgi:hypothetical protein
MEISNETFRYVKFCMEIGLCHKQAYTFCMNLFYLTVTNKHGGREKFDVIPDVFYRNLA